MNYQDLPTGLQSKIRAVLTCFDQCIVTRSNINGMYEVGCSASVSGLKCGDIDMIGKYSAVEVFESVDDWKDEFAKQNEGNAKVIASAMNYVPMSLREGAK